MTTGKVLTADYAAQVQSMRENVGRPPYRLIQNEYFVDVEEKGKTIYQEGSTTHNDDYSSMRRTYDNGDVMEVDIAKYGKDGNKNWYYDHNSSFYTFAHNYDLKSFEYYDSSNPDVPKYQGYYENSYGNNSSSGNLSYFAVDLDSDGNIDRTYSYHYSLAYGQRLESMKYDLNDDESTDYYAEFDYNFRKTKEMFDLNSDGKYDLEYEYPGNGKYTVKNLETQEAEEYYEDTDELVEPEKSSGILGFFENLFN